MSIFANNISSKNIVELENTVSSQYNKIQQLIDFYSDQTKRSYDQTTKQNVIVSFNSLTQRYRFEIQKNEENKENDIFMYQIWKKNNDELNSDRRYKDISLRSWISQFKISKNVSNFTPTTLIEINNTFYPTVMVDAGIENNLCVFYFEVKSIIHPQGLINYLPQIGSYNNVRFDIDDIYDIYYNITNVLIGGYWYFFNYIEYDIPILSAYYFNNTEVTLYDFTSSKSYNSILSLNQTSYTKYSGILLDKNGNQVNFDITSTDNENLYLLAGNIGQDRDSFINRVILTIGGIKYTRCNPIDPITMSNYVDANYVQSINTNPTIFSSIKYPNFSVNILNSTNSSYGGSGTINPLISLSSYDFNFKMFCGFFPFISGTENLNIPYMFTGGDFTSLFILGNRLMETTASIYGNWAFTGENSKTTIAIKPNNSILYKENNPEYNIINYTYNGMYDPVSQHICINQADCSILFILDSNDSNKAILDRGGYQQIFNRYY